MEYRCISADCHIDLSWLPHDLFVSNASQAMKDRMPYVTDGSDGPMWVTKAGLNLGLANGKGCTGVMGYRNKYVAGKVHRADRMASTGLFSDASQGILRPTTPELRLRDQDRDGLQAEVLYGLHGTGIKMKDLEPAVEFYRIYNNWLSDFCSHDRNRFLGLASIASHDVAVAVAETYRAAKLGLRGLDVLVSLDTPPLWDPDWDPLWKAAADVNLAVHFHTISSPVAAPVRENLPENVKLGSYAAHLTGATLTVAPLLASVIYGGALERYPNLRIVFGESGIGWIPYVLERMDYEYENRFKNSIGLKMKPSDYWRRQCRATFQNDRIGIKNLDDLGAETVMWASDFPHPDGTFPDSQEIIKNQLGHLPVATQRKITCENAAKLYGLMAA